MIELLKKLASTASALDNSGLYVEADCVLGVLEKVAQGNPQQVMQTRQNAGQFDPAVDTPGIQVLIALQTQYKIDPGTMYNTLAKVDQNLANNYHAQITQSGISLPPPPTSNLNPALTSAPATPQAQSSNIASDSINILNTASLKKTIKVAQDINSEANTLLNQIKTEINTTLNPILTQLVNTTASAADTKGATGTGWGAVAENFRRSAHTLESIFNNHINDFAKMPVTQKTQAVSGISSIATKLHSYYENKLKGKVGGWLSIGAGQAGGNFVDGVQVCERIINNCSATLSGTYKPASQ